MVVLELEPDSEWRMFRYLQPKLYGSRGIDISKFYKKEYRLKIASDIPERVRKALYGYRYVQEFAFLLGYVYLIISNADEHFTSQKCGTLSSRLQIYACECRRYVPNTFDYEQLAKELWDDQRPDFVSDVDLWSCYRKEQQAIMERFKEVVNCYVKWDHSWNRSSLQALTIGFNNLLEVQ